MILVHPSHTIEAGILGEDAVRLIEAAARTCYKSEPKGDPCGFVRKVLHQLHHESVIEHSHLSVRFVTSRGVTHELVRHRLAAFSQESTRYVDYVKRECQFVIPAHIADEFRTLQNKDGTMTGPYHTESSPIGNRWYAAMLRAEAAYLDLRSVGATPQQARGVLPNDTRTEIVMSANFREWRHVLKLRTSAAAHPDMRALMVPLLLELQQRVPVIFDDITPKE